MPGAVLGLGVVSLLTDISSESVAAILPLYITVVVGLGPLAFGFIDGIYQGISAFVRIAGGRWADRSDRPKWVAFVGYGLSALTRLGLLVVSGFWAITSVVAVDRLGKGLRTGPRDSLIATASDPEHLGRNFGVHRAMDTAGALIGPLMAFAILAMFPIGLGGYQTVFVWSFAFAVVGVAVLAAGGAGSAEPLTAADADSASPAEAASADAGPTDAGPASRRRRRAAAVAGPRQSGPAPAADRGRGAVPGHDRRRLPLSRRCRTPARSPPSYFPLLFVGTNFAYLVACRADGQAGRPDRPRQGLRRRLRAAAGLLCDRRLPIRRPDRRRAGPAAARHLLRRHRRRAGRAGQPPGAAPRAGPAASAPRRPWSRCSGSSPRSASDCCGSSPACRPRCW